MLLFLMFALSGVSAHAHFNLNVNIRTFHVVHTQSGLDVYVRMPTPYFLAELFYESPETGEIFSAPFTYNQSEDDAIWHLLNLQELRNYPFEFANIAADGLRIEVDGVPLAQEIIAVRVHDALSQPPFATLSEAKAAVEGQVFDYPTEEIYVGDTVTDLLLRYKSGKPVDSFDISSSFNPNLPEQEETANLVIDHFPGSSRVFRLRGLLNEPVRISNSMIAAALTFVYQGIIHILEGLDHLLFVICLTIGAASLINLLWRVTGFTIGHTVTLIAGFWGYVPAGAWFVPTVELCIAISIIYVALIAVRKTENRSDRHGSFLVTLAIGLLHGLGFSFVLQELLLPDGAHLWKSLLAFNIGVEVGQVMIVLAVWMALILVKALKKEMALHIMRWAVALPCMIVSAYWVVERIKPIIEVF